MLSASEYSSTKVTKPKALKTQTQPCSPTEPDSGPFVSKRPTTYVRKKPEPSSFYLVKLAVRFLLSSKPMHWVLQDFLWCFEIRAAYVLTGAGMLSVECVFSRVS